MTSKLPPFLPSKGHLAKTTSANSTTPSSLHLCSSPRALDLALQMKETASTNHFTCLLLYATIFIPRYLLCHAYFLFVHCL